MFKLHGDGIHDDTPAVQELIDSSEDELLVNTSEIEKMDSE